MLCDRCLEPAVEGTESCARHLQADIDNKEKADKKIQKVLEKRNKKNPNAKCYICNPMKGSSNIEDLCPLHAKALEYDKRSDEALYAEAEATQHLPEEYLDERAEDDEISPKLAKAIDELREISYWWTLPNFPSWLIY